MSEAKIPMTCEICGKQYKTRQWQLDRGWGYTCGSRQCRNEKQVKTWKEKRDEIETNPKLRGWGYA